eukprot:SAG22_NODE_6014_length_915_cov_4.595588_2_plen_26_part_01
MIQLTAACNLENRATDAAAAAAAAAA